MNKMLNKKKNISFQEFTDIYKNIYQTNNHSSSTENNTNEYIFSSKIIFIVLLILIILSIIFFIFQKTLKTHLFNCYNSINNFQTNIT